MNNNVNDEYFRNNIFAYFIFLSAILLTVIILGWVLILSRYGLDITDESFYLNWLANPWIYSGSITQFGFIYHPLHLLFHGDIAQIRQSNIVINFGLSWMVFFILFKDLFKNTRNKSYDRFIIIFFLALIFATSSLVYVCSFRWLITPSYNSLTLQALLLASIGVLLAEKKASLISIGGWIIIGLSAWLSFMAKPTSALALTVVVGVYILGAGKFNFKLLLLSLITGLVLMFIAAWTIDGSIALFIERYLIGFNNMKLMQLDNPLFKIEQFPLADKEKYVLAGIIGILSILSYFTGSSKKLLNNLGLSLTSLLIISSLLVIGGVVSVSMDIHNFAVLQMLSISLSAVLIMGIVLVDSQFVTMTRKNLMLAFYFVTLPYVLALGTSNNYWLQSQLAAVFWVCAGLVILLPEIIRSANWSLLLPLAVGSQLITVVLLQMAMEYPYRQHQSLREYNTRVSVGAWHSEIILTKELADFFSKTNALIAQNGFKPNTPIIDLTGQSPGMLYIMGAKPIAQPWLMGGYPGSKELAIASLNSVACSEIAESWILMELQSTQRLSSDILSNYGIDINYDYNLVAQYVMPLGISGSDVNINRKQLLLKPVRSIEEATAACDKRR